MLRLALLLLGWILSGCATPSLASGLRDYLEAQVRDGAFPGAVAMVSVDRGVVAAVAVGHETYEDGARPMRMDTVFDLASLTKVCAALPAIERLLRAGKLRLDDPVGEWVSGFDERVTVRMLMTHRSGLPASAPLWRKHEGKEAIIGAAARVALVAEPGTVTRYSDLGPMLLTAVVEAAADESFDQFASSYGFRFGARDAAPTESGVPRGIVHDENARAMGGVSGHAGLFGTAADVRRVGEDYLFGDELRRSLRTRVGPGMRALLWDAYEPGRSSGGALLGSAAFGHTGFTGTSIWCDPSRGLCAVLLTNRVHPTRDNLKIRAVRREFHDLVVRRLFDIE